MNEQHNNIISPETVMAMMMVMMQIHSHFLCFTGTNIGLKNYLPNDFKNYYLYFAFPFPNSKLLNKQASIRKF